MLLKLPFMAFSGFVLFGLISRYQEESGCNKGSKGLKWPNMDLNCLIWPKIALSGLLPNLVLYGLLWPKMANSGLEWPNLAFYPIGLIWPNMA